MPLTLAEIQASLSADASKLNAALAKAGADINSFAATNTKTIDSVGEAFKTLGVKSEASLSAAAVKAVQAFDTIRQSGTASAQDVANAEAAMQKAVGAATGQVVQSMDSTGQSMTRTLSSSQALRAESLALGGEFGRLGRAAALVAPGIGTMGAAMLGIGVAAAFIIPKIEDWLNSTSKAVKVNEGVIETNTQVANSLSGLDDSYVKISEHSRFFADSLAAGTTPLQSTINLNHDAAAAAGSFAAASVKQADAVSALNGVFLQHNSVAVLAAGGLDGLAHKQAEAQSAIQAATGALQNATRVLLEFYINTNISKDKLVEMAIQSGASVNAVNQLVATLNSGSKAALSFADALDKVHIAQLNLGGTSQGLAKLQDDLRASSDKLTKAGLNYLDFTVAQMPVYQQLQKEIQKTVAAEEEHRTKQQMQAEVTSRLNAAIQAGTAVQGVANSGIKDGATIVENFEKNLKTLTETHKAHGAAAKQNFDSMKEAIVGAIPGLTEIITRLQAGEPVFDELATNTTKASRAFKGELTVAMKSAVDAVNEYGQSMGVNAKFTTAELGAMVEAHGTNLLQLALRWAAAREAIRQHQLLMLTDAGANMPKFDSIIGEAGQIVAETFSGIQQMVKATDEGIVKFVTDAHREFDELNAAAPKPFADQVQDLIGKLNNLGNTTALMRQLGEAFKAAGLVAGDSLTKINAGWVALVADMQAKNPGVPIQAAADKMGTLANVWDDVKTRVLHINQQISQGMIDLVSAITGATGQLAEKVKRDLNDIAAVVATMPGKFGDAVRGVNRTVQQWFDFAQAVLKILHDMVSSKIPASLGDLVTVMTGGTKQATQAAQTTMQTGMDTVNQTVDDAMQTMNGDFESGMQTVNTTVATQTGQVVTQVQGMAAKAITAVAGMMAGIAMVISGHAQGGAMGAISGALGGFMTGATIGSLIAPGIGTIIGGVVGAIGGFFAGLFGGGGKSIQQQEADKQAQLQTQQMQQNLQKGAQDVIDAAMKTFQDALETLDKLADFTKVPKATIKAFFANLDQLLNEFSKMAADFSGDLMDKAKKLADDMGPIVTTIGDAVNSLNALNGFTAVPESSVAAFMKALSDTMTAFNAWVDANSIKTVRLARRFADNIGDVISMIGSGITALSGLITFKAPASDAITQFMATLDIVVRAVQQMADAADNFLLKGAQRFSQKVNDVVTMVGNSLTAFVGLTTFTAPAQDTMDGFVATMKTIISQMIDLANQIDAAGLVAASKFSDRTVSIFNAIKTGVDALQSLANFKAIPQEALDAFLFGFDQALDMMGKLIDKAEAMKNLADAFALAMGGVASSITSGVGKLTSSLGTLAVATGATGGPFVKWGPGPSTVGGGASATVIHLTVNATPTSMADYNRLIDMAKQFAGMQQTARKY